MLPPSTRTTMTPKTTVLPLKVHTPITELRALVLPHLVSPTPTMLDMALVAQVQLTSSTQTITSPSHSDQTLAQTRHTTQQASLTTHQAHTHECLTRSSTKD